MPWHQDPKTNRPKTKVTSASHFSWPQGRAVRYLNLLPILAFLCPFCRRERFSLERDLRHHQAACPHADNTDSLPSTLESANGRNGGSPYFIPPQPFPQYLIYRERPSGDDPAPDRMRGGQNAFQSTSSLSQSNGVTTPVPDQFITGAVNNGSASSPPARGLSASIHTAPSPELLTVRRISSDQPIEGSTRYTIWENVIEMPSNVPYDSLLDFRYIFTPSTRVSYVDIPDEEDEEDIDDGDDEDDMDGVVEASSDA